MSFFGKLFPGTPGRGNILLEVSSKNYVQKIELLFDKPDWGIVLKNKQVSPVFIRTHENQVRINGEILKKVAALKDKGFDIDLKFVVYDGSYNEVKFLSKDTVFHSIDMAVLQKLKNEDLNEYIKEALELALYKIRKK